LAFEFDAHEEGAFGFLVRGINEGFHKGWLTVVER
jgi:hypothetical protein